MEGKCLRGQDASAIEGPLACPHEWQASSKASPNLGNSDPNTPFWPGHRTLEPEIALRLRTAVRWETAAVRGLAKPLHSSAAAAAGELRSDKFCGFFPDSANLAPGEKNARSI